MNILTALLIISGAAFWACLGFYLLTRLDAFLMGRKW